MNKFIRWLKYNPPFSGTADEWLSFNERFKKNAPIRYYIVRGTPSRVYIILKYRVSKLFYNIKFRFIHKYHVVDTGLKPDYYDIPILMLHVNFNMLVNYVENECSHLYAYNDSTRYKNLYGVKRLLPWLFKSSVKKNKEYAKKYGLAYLEWAATLDCPDLPEYKQSVGQAKAAREVIALYKWWTEERPNRKDLESPVTRKIDKLPLFTTLSEKWKKENPELSEQWSIHVKNQFKLEENWRKEDTEMLIRLIKVRSELWT